jgi:hypothetical protein
VEFRRPPGVRDAKCAKHWIAFTLGFVNKSIGFEFDSIIDEKEYPTPPQLLLFIQDGLAPYWDSSFHGALNADWVKEIRV